MLVEIDGVDAHAEDRWVGGAPVRIGEALIAFDGHVGRCLITSRDPETGQVDLPTLDILGEYRDSLGLTEPLPFGVWGRVLEPGTVRLGDQVTLLDG
jgi:MOSC domain-containing protein